MQAVVVSVDPQTPGSVVASALTAGDMGVVVESTAPFPEPPEGGTLAVLVNGETLTYSGILDADDYASGVTQDALVLAAPAPSSAAFNTPVTVPGQVVYVAQVVVGDADKPQPALVPPHIASDAGLVGATVDLARMSGEPRWEVTEIIGQAPSLDLGFAAPATLTPDKVDRDEWTAEGTTVSLLNDESAFHPGLTVTGATLRSSPPGSGLQTSGLNAGGLFGHSESGAPTVTVGTEPGARPHWSGIVDAASLTVDTGVVQQQLDVGPTAHLNLASGTLTPLTPPQAAKYWDLLPVDPPLSIDINALRGMVERDGDYYIGYAPIGAASQWLYTIDGSTGALSQYIDITAIPVQYRVTGLTWLGGQWFTIGFTPDGQTLIFPIDDDGTIHDPFPYVRKGSSGSTPTIGTDGTDLLIVDRDPTTRVVWVTRTTPPPALSHTTVELGVLPIAGLVALAGVQFGDFGYGANVWVVWATFERDMLAAVYLDSDRTHLDTDLSFAVANGEPVECACWDATLGRFASIGAATSGVWRYGGHALDGIDLGLYVASTWVNATNGYETTVSWPATKILGANLAGLRANVGTLPGAGGPEDPEFGRVYFCDSGGGDPTPPSWSILGDADPITGDIAVLDVTFGFEGAPAANNFPQGGGGDVTADGVVVIAGGYSHPDDLDTRVTALEAGGGGSPTGPAGGDLAGTYPDPTLADTPTARANLGLGSAATQPSTAFDAAGAAAAAQAASQPLDSDLTTIAGLAATTDNLIQSVAGAWASRTPAQVRTTLGLSSVLVGLFGDGSDGTVAFDGTTGTLSGVWTRVGAGAGAVYVLGRDLYATDLHISNGCVLSHNSCRIFVSGTLTIDAGASFSADGPAGAGSVGGSGGGSVTLGRSGSGGNGGTTGAGSAGSSLAACIGGAAGAGGAGNIFAGGAAGGGSALSPAAGTPRHLMQAINMMRLDSYSSFNGGSGGGGGGGSGTGTGTSGGGGAGGFPAAIIARTIINGGLISANGGAGAAAVLGTAAGRGGGGGGGGGWVSVVSTSALNGTVQALGGTGGAGVGTGATGADGAAGTVCWLQV